MDQSPRDTVARINARIPRVKDPLHREILESFRDHYWAEAVGDLDAIMATLAPSPSFRSYGSKSIGTVELDTTEEVRALYGSFIEKGCTPTGILEGERIAIGDWGMTCEAIQHVTFPGSFLSDPRYAPNDRFLVSQRFVSVHPYDADRHLLTGEVGYMDDPFNIEPLRPESNPNFSPGDASFSERLEI